MTCEPQGECAKNERELEDKLAQLEKAIWSLVWILGAICAAMLVALVWVYVRGRGLNAEMDVVAASLGGG